MVSWLIYTFNNITTDQNKKKLSNIHLEIQTLRLLRHTAIMIIEIKISIWLAPFDQKCKPSFCHKKPNENKFLTTFLQLRLQLGWTLAAGLIVFSRCAMRAYGRECKIVMSDERTRTTFSNVCLHAHIHDVFSIFSHSLARLQSLKSNSGVIKNVFQAAEYERRPANLWAA